MGMRMFSIIQFFTRISVYNTRPRVVESRVLRRTFGPKMDEIIVMSFIPCTVHQM
jgi:hypothetical protein